jgi:hypothetical protein
MQNGQICGRTVRINPYQVTLLNSVWYFTLLECTTVYKLHTHISEKIVHEKFTIKKLFSTFLVLDHGQCKILPRLKIRRCLFFFFFLRGNVYRMEEKVQKNEFSLLKLFFVLEGIGRRIHAQEVRTKRQWLNYEQ